MKYLILILGAIGALLFIFSLYAFLFNWGLFKPVAYAFLVVAVVVFVLMFITKLREEKEMKQRRGRR